MKNVLVTGVAGFLGSNLLGKLLDNGHTVIGIDNLTMGTLSNMQPYLHHPRFTFYQKDIVDPGTFESLEEDIDTIIHLAAFKIPRYGKAIDTLKINGKGGENVLEFAKDRVVKCVLASTSDVYGMSPDLPFIEDGNSLIGTSTVARWSYAVSKLYDEHLALAYMDAYGFPVTLLRFFGSYGPNQHLSWWGGPQSVFIEKILKDEEIPIHGDGQQTRTFTYVDDTVNGIYLAALKEEANGEILNIGAGIDQEITILDLAKLLKRISGTPGELNYKLIPYDNISQGRKYQDVLRRVPDTSKAKALLGFSAQVNIEEGMARTFAWQRETTQIGIHS
ncbi:MAG: GDP-mannose 4,6-dehydratase [Saprospiraceae bacterium]